MVFSENIHNGRILSVSGLLLAIALPHAIVRCVVVGSIDSVCNELLKMNCLFGR